MEGQQPVSDGFDEAVLLGVLSDVKSGDFTVRMPVEWTGVAGKIADRLNDVIAANQTLETELARVSRVVVKEGKLSHRVSHKGADQVWGSCTAYVTKPGDTAGLLLVLGEWLPSDAPAGEPPVVPG